MDTKILSRLFKQTSSSYEVLTYDKTIRRNNLTSLTRDENIVADQQ